MTTPRDHIALRNNDNTIFDLPIDETAQLLTDATTYYAKQLAYVTTNTSDSHIDDFMMISDILHQLMPLTTYGLSDADDDIYRYELELAFEPSLINNILYFDRRNNCALTIERPQLLSHFNDLTDDQIDELAADL